MIKIKTVKDVLFELDMIAPKELIIQGDNCGLMVGDIAQPITTCIIAMDITNSIIDMAIEKKAELIITHHPLIYNPIKNITYDNVIARLIRHNISVISCHSNLDAVKGGVNDQLIQGLDLTNIDVLSKSDNMGRIGKSKSKMTGYQLALKLKAIVRAPYIQVINGDKSLRKIAVVSGSGGSYMDQALEKRADAFVTGEVKHDQIIYALNNNLVLIILGHHYSERVVLNPLKQKLQAVLNEILFVTEDNFEMRYL